jgi:O-antigen biosynthesis protein
MKLLFMTSPAPKKAGLSTAEKRPPLGTGILISLLKKRGHELSFRDEYLNPSGILDGEFLQRERIDAVGIYSNTICYSGTREMLYKLQIKRERGNWKGKILVGGPHTSAALETIPDFVDHIVIGEGEISVPKIVEGNVADRIVVGEKVSDMDSLPMPAWEEFIYRDYDWTSPWSDVYPVYTMNTSRGCPFQCSFCSVQAVWGKSYRYMSAQRVVEDVEHMVSHYGAKGIYFREDHFTLDKQRTMEFCELLLKRNTKVEWYCETRIDQMGDPEYQALMARAGCKAFYIGVESGSPRMLELFKKGETVDQFVRAFEIARSVGIRTYASFVVGAPFETAEDTSLTEKLIEKIHPYKVGRNVYIGLPGSEIYKSLLKDKAYEYKDQTGVIYPNGYLENVDKYYGGNEYFKPYALTPLSNKTIIPYPPVKEELGENSKAADIKRQDRVNEELARRFSEKDISLFRRSKVVLFGSGSLATLIYRYLHEREIFPYIVFDNDSKKEGALFKGTKVAEPFFIEEAKVIIASMWEHEIALQLEALGYRRGDIFLMGFEA